MQLFLHFIYVVYRMYLYINNEKLYMSQLLNVQDLKAKIGQKDILTGANLEINAGEVHVIMGPNGSGKSTLANVVMGNPKFEQTGGSIEFKGENINESEPEERSAAGLFMAFQYPREIAGVQLDRFLFLAYQTIMKARHGDDVELMSVFDFNKKLQEEMEKLSMKKEFATRSLNQGFSGGEKKKAEMLQLAMLEPELVILDETDSGLDVDALKIVAEGVNRFKSEKTGVLIVTHYQRILQYLKPDFVHVMVDGKIVKSGGPELAKELEENGYEKYLES